MSTIPFLRSATPGAAPAPRVPPARRTADLRRWISPVAIVLVWQLASSTGLLAEDELASPWRVVTAAVDVTVSGELPEGPPLIEAARAGAIDVGATGNTPVIFAAAARARVQIVAANRGNVVSDAVLVPRCAGPG